MLPWQMAEQLAVEVDVKNPDTVAAAGVGGQAYYFVWIIL